MDTQINECVKLPFSIHVWVGEGVKAYRQSLTVSSFADNEIRNNIRITESQNLYLELETEDPDVEVELYWEKVLLIDEQEEIEPFILNLANPRISLFNYAERDYPWRCGIYHYEFKHNGKSYFGSYEIVPKNVSEEQLEYIHNTINTHITGLVNDYLATKQSGTLNMDLDQIMYWRYFSWYKEYEPLLLNAIRFIENNSEQVLKEAYFVETLPRRQTHKSVRWESGSGGAIYKGAKYYNRKMEPEIDTTLNQTVKWRLKSMCIQMQQAMISLREVYGKFAYRHDGLSAEIEKLNERLLQLEKQKTVSKADKENIRTTILIKQNERQKLTSQLRSLQLLEEEYIKNQNTLQGILQSVFWKSILDRIPRKLNDGNGWGHKLINQIWLQSQTWGNTQPGLKKMGSPVSRPTHLLYEYYVFFLTIETLLGLGYKIEEDTVYTQLENSFSFQGLLEASYVTLTNGPNKVKIIYDELIESHANTALQMKTNFYSSELKRKPDIRLDHYLISENGEFYQSSMILEVKYRPFYNIYNEHGNTTSMIQMSKYWAIGFIDNEGKYKRRPIKQVVCVYPGDDKKEIIIEDQHGLFLQLYPQSRENIVGALQLSELVNAWIAG